MTLLSICQQAANEIPIAAPTAIIGNPDETATLLLACAQATGNELARRAQGGWIDQIKEYDFQTVALGPMTGTVTLNSKIITGITSTAGIVANTFYVFGTGVPADAIVQSVDSINQITMNLAATANGSSSLTFGQGDYALPSDFSRFVDDTMWDRTRYWEMRGPLSAQEWQYYKASPAGKVSILRRWRVRRISGVKKFSIDPPPTDNASNLVLEYVSTGWCQSASGTAQTSWTLDTDTGILDEYLMTLGIKARMLDRLGMAASSALQEYLAEVDKALAADGGMPVLYIAQPSAWGTQLGNPALVINFPTT